MPTSPSYVSSGSSEDRPQADRMVTDFASQEGGKVGARGERLGKGQRICFVADLEPYLGLRTRPIDLLANTKRCVRHDHAQAREVLHRAALFCRERVTGRHNQTQ